MWTSTIKQLPAADSTSSALLILLSGILDWMWKNSRLLGELFLFMNLLTFIFFALDKSRSMHRQWRIPERTLILLSVLGGALGGFLAMQLFRHKTRHKKFRYGVPFFMVLQGTLAILIWLYGHGIFPGKN